NGGDGLRVGERDATDAAAQIDGRRRRRQDVVDDHARGPQGRERGRRQRARRGARRRRRPVEARVDRQGARHGEGTALVTGGGRRLDANVGAAPLGGLPAQLHAGQVLALDLEATLV